LTAYLVDCAFKNNRTEYEIIKQSSVIKNASKGEYQKKYNEKSVLVGFVTDTINVNYFKP
jgi:hypothetical protein